MTRASESLMRTFEAQRAQMTAGEQTLLLAMISQLAATEQVVEEIRALRETVKRTAGWS